MNEWEWFRMDINVCFRMFYDVSVFEYPLFHHNSIMADLQICRIEDPNVWMKRTNRQTRHQILFSGIISNDWWLTTDYSLYLFANQSGSYRFLLRWMMVVLKYFKKFQTLRARKVTVQFYFWDSQLRGKTVFSCM